MSAAEFWNAESVRTAVGGHWLTRPDQFPVLAGGGAIDTRALQPGQIFFALRGEHTDGHRFLARAHEAGAALAIIDDPEAAGELPPGLATVRVADARAALGRLASAYRTALAPIRVAAVTGSNGKTTTTRMIDACLRAHMRGHSSPKSFNNDLGVPLTILGTRPGDQYLLCEVGANDPGEIEPLSHIIRPQVVAILNVGRAHLEGFGSVEGVAAEKASLAAHLEPGGLVILHAESPALAPWRDRFERVITFGTSPDADLRVSDIRQTPAGLSFTLNERDEFSLPIPGAHNAANAAAAIAVARRLGVTDDLIRDALAGFTPPDMRLTREQIAGIDVINDAYNANPDSMLASLRTLRALAPAGSRRVAILADMLEMGPDGPDAHREVGRAIAAERLADLVITLGPLAALIAEEASGVETIPLDKSEPAAAAARLVPGDTVLLKGSRGMALERVLDALRQASPVSPPA